MVEVNANAVHNCYLSFLTYLDRSMQSYESEFYQPSNILIATRERRLQQYESLLALISTAADFCWLNAEGFRKIVKKFDKRTGARFRASEGVLASLRCLAFHSDAHEPDGGRALSRARERLRSWAAAIRESLADSPPPAPGGPLTAAAPAPHVAERGRRASDCCAASTWPGGTAGHDARLSSEL